jgi:hypothetical protein
MEGREKRDSPDGLIHMHTNRLLTTDARRQEMVLYDVLHRLYDAQVARTRIAATA